MLGVTGLGHHLCNFFFTDFDARIRAPGPAAHRPSSWSLAAAGAGRWARTGADHLGMDRDGCIIQWIGLGENLQENPIFNGKNHGFL